MVLLLRNYKKNNLKNIRGIILKEKGIKFDLEKQHFAQIPEEFHVILEVFTVQNETSF